MPLQQGDHYLSTVTLFAYDAADVMYDDNFATVVKINVVQMSTKKLLMLDHLVLGRFYLRKL